MASASGVDCSIDSPPASPRALTAAAHGSESWDVALTRAQRTPVEMRDMSPSLKAFYESQNELISFYRGVETAGDDAYAIHLANVRAHEAGVAAAVPAASTAPLPATAVAPHVAPIVPPPPSPSRLPRESSSARESAEGVESARVARLVTLAINLSFGANVVLLAIKVFAAITSGSLSVIASTVDSVMDLVSGGVVWFSAILAARRQPYTFPVGKSRFEPLSIIIFACLMGAASLQLITQGIVALLAGAPTNTEGGGASTYGILVAIIVTKASLWLLCTSLKRYSTSLGALALDHWGDVITNLAPLVAVLIVAQFPVAWPLDPIAAILMSVYMLSMWGQAASEQAALLTGKAASAREVSEITYLALTHDASVLAVDTVLAYSQGNKLLAEIDIVLPRSMPLWESHDVGEGLQRKIERLINVERAFVHADYEVTHHRDDEHWPPLEQPSYAPE